MSRVRINISNPEIRSSFNKHSRKTVQKSHLSTTILIGTIINKILRVNQKAFFGNRNTTKNVKLFQIIHPLKEEFEIPNGNQNP